MVAPYSLLSNRLENILCAYRGIKIQLKHRIGFAPRGNREQWLQNFIQDPGLNHGFKVFSEKIADVAVLTDSEKLN